MNINKNGRLASRLLCLAMTNGRGGYTTEFGACTMIELINLITGNDKAWCNNNGHIKHDILNVCIICGVEVEKVYQISAKYFTAGINVVNDKVIKAAPIIKWMIGKNIAYIKSYCNKKHFNFILIK